MDGHKLFGSRNSERPTQVASQLAAKLATRPMLGSTNQYTAIHADDEPGLSQGGPNQWGSFLAAVSRAKTGFDRARTMILTLVVPLLDSQR